MDQELLSKESYSELLKPHSEVLNSFLIDISYTLGFMTPDFLFIDTDMYLHSGYNDGFTCRYAIDIEKDWRYLLFTNSEYGEQLGEELLFYFMGINSPKILYRWRYYDFDCSVWNSVIDLGYYM